MVGKGKKEKDDVKIIELCRVGRRMQQSQSYLLKTPLHLLIMGLQNAIFINALFLYIYFPIKNSPKNMNGNKPFLH